MSRNIRMEHAKEAVAICNAGQYTSLRGQRVDIAAALKSAKAGTVIYAPERVPTFQERTRRRQRELRW
jgi:hypothetical protein